MEGLIFGILRYASLNNSQNNCHRNYANGPDISTNADVQIDRSIFASYRMHARNYFAPLGIFMRKGRRGNKLTV